MGATISYCPCTQVAKHRYKRYIVAAYTTAEQPHNKTDNNDKDNNKQGKNSSNRRGNDSVHANAEAVERLCSYAAHNPERVPRVCRKIVKRVRVHITRRAHAHIRVSVQLLLALLTRTRSVDACVPHTLDVCELLLYGTVQHWGDGAGGGVLSCRGDDVDDTTTTTTATATAAARANGSSSRRRNGGGDGCVAVTIDNSARGVAAAVLAHRIEAAALLAQLCSRLVSSSSSSSPQQQDSRCRRRCRRHDAACRLVADRRDVLLRYLLRMTGDNDDDNNNNNATATTADEDAVTCTVRWQGQYAALVALCHVARCVQPTLTTTEAACMAHALLRRGLVACVRAHTLHTRCACCHGSYKSSADWRTLVVAVVSAMHNNTNSSNSNDNNNATVAPAAAAVAQPPCTLLCAVATAQQGEDDAADGVTADVQLPCCGAAAAAFVVATNNNNNINNKNTHSSGDDDDACAATQARVCAAVRVCMCGLHAVTAAVAACDVRVFVRRVLATLDEVDMSHTTSSRKNNNNNKGNNNKMCGAGVVSVWSLPALPAVVFAPLVRSLDALSQPRGVVLYDELCSCLLHAANTLQHHCNSDNDDNNNMAYTATRYAGVLSALHTCLTHMSLHGARPQHVCAQLLRSVVARPITLVCSHNNNNTEEAVAAAAAVSNHDIAKDACLLATSHNTAAVLLWSTLLSRLCRQQRYDDVHTALIALLELITRQQQQQTQRDDVTLLCGVNVQGALQCLAATASYARVQMTTTYTPSSPLRLAAALQSASLLPPLPSAHAATTATTTTTKTTTREHNNGVDSDSSSSNSLPWGLHNTLAAQTLCAALAGTSSLRALHNNNSNNNKKKKAGQLHTSADDVRVAVAWLRSVVSRSLSDNNNDDGDEAAAAAAAAATTTRNSAVHNVVVSNGVTMRQRLRGRRGVVTHAGVTAQCLVDVANVMTALQYTSGNVSNSSSRRHRCGDGDDDAAHDGGDVRLLIVVLQLLYRIQDACMHAHAHNDDDDDNASDVHDGDGAMSAARSSPLTRAWLHVTVAVLASCGHAWCVASLVTYAHRLLKRRRAAHVVADCFLSRLVHVSAAASSSSLPAQQHHCSNIDGSSVTATMTDASAAHMTAAAAAAAASSSSTTTSLSFFSPIRCAMSAVVNDTLPCSGLTLALRSDYNNNNNNNNCTTATTAATAATTTATTLSTQCTLPAVTALIDFDKVLSLLAEAAATTIAAAAAATATTTSAAAAGNATASSSSTSATATLRVASQRLQHELRRHTAVAGWLTSSTDTTVQARLQLLTSNRGNSSSTL